MTESQNATSTPLKSLFGKFRAFLRKNKLDIEEILYSHTAAVLLLDLQNDGDEFSTLFIFNPEIGCFIKISQFYFHKNNQKV